MGSTDCFFISDLSRECLIQAVSTVCEKDKNGLPISGSLMEMRSKDLAEKQILKIPTVRRMLIEFQDIFNRCRSMCVHGKLSVEDTLMMSREYRAVLRSSVDTEDSNNAFHRDYALWSLFETMFLRRGDSSFIMDLIDWAHNSFCDVTVYAKQTMLELEQGVPLADGSFWTTMARLVVGLRFDLMVQFLDFMKNDAAAILLREHLFKLDFDWLGDERTLEKYEKWQQELASLDSLDRFSSNRNIVFLVRVITGHEKMLARMSEHLVSDWWLMVPIVTFAKYGRVQFQEIGDVAENCFYMKGHSEMDTNDPFLSVFKLSDVKSLEAMLSNHWLSVHLIDLMYSSIAYDHPITDIRIRLLIRYGSFLFGNPDLWELGAYYLLHCGVSEGKRQLETHICLLPFDDEILAEKLLRLCSEHDLEESRTCVINTITYRHLRNHNWDAALSWALRGGKSKILDTVVHRIVWDSKEGDVSSLSVLENLDNLLRLSPSLTFLFGYYRFHTTLERADMEGATKILISLVISSDVPSAFHSVLFGYLIGILREVKQLKIPRSTVYDLLSFCKQWDINQPADDYDDNQKKMRCLKELLLKRLATSIIS